MNHWLKLHKIKKSRYWTAEFIDGTFNYLKSRRVEVDGEPHLVGSLEIVFQNADINDSELLSFLRYSRKTMVGIRSNLRNYESFDQIQGFCLKGLSCKDFYWVDGSIHFGIEYKQVLKIGPI